MFELLWPINTVNTTLLVGIGHAAGLFWVVQKNVSDVSRKEAVGLVWVGLGFMSLASVPVYLLLEWGLLAPIPVFLVISFELFRSGIRVEGALVAFAFEWPIIVFFYVVLGFLEFIIRRALTNLLIVW